jgi:hypothetical protein
MTSDEQNADKPIPDDSAQRPVEQPLAEVFGIEVRYSPDECAPPVDLEKLRKYVRDELAVAETEEVCHLIASFRSWHDACTELFKQQLNR